MEIFSFNLITIGIVIFILAVFRYLDKNNRSLEKVKRFSDKEQEKLAGFIDSKTREIQNLAIELQVNLKTGKEILKRITDSESELANKAESFESVRKKIYEYDTLIEELNGATVTVEENIKKIRDESAFVTSVSKQIKGVQSRLSEVESSIPVLRSELCKKNVDDARNEKNKILEEIGTKVHGYKQESLLLEKKLKDYAGFMTKLETRSQSFETEMVKAIDTHLAEFECKVAEKKNLEASDFSIQIDTLLAKGSEQKESLVKDLEEALSGSTDGVESAETELREVLVLFKNEAAAIEGELGKKLENARENGRCIEKDMFEGCKGSIAKSADEVKKLFDEKYATMSAEIEEATNMFVREMTHRQKEYEAGFDEHLVEVDGRVEVVKQELDANEQKLNEEAKRIAGIADELQKQYADMRVRFDESSASMRSSIGELKAGFYGEVVDASSELEIKIMKRIEKQLCEYENDLGYRLKKLEDTSVDIGRLDATMRESMEVKKEEIREQLVLFAKDLEEKAFKEKSEHARILGEMTQSIQTLDSEVTELKSKAYREVSEKLKLFEDTFFSDLKVRQETIDASFAKWESDISSTCAEKLSTFEEIASGFKQNAGERKDELAQVLKELGDEMQEARREMEELSDGTSKDFTEKLSHLGDGLTRDLEERGEKIENRIEEWEKDIRRTLDDKIYEFEEIVIDFENNAKNKKADQERITRELSDGMDAVNRELGIFRDNAYKDFSTKVSMFEEGFMADIRSRSEKIEGSIAKWQTVVNEGIDTKIRDFEASIDEKYAGYETQWIKLINTKLGGVNEKFTAVSRQFDEYYDRLKKEMDIIEKKQAYLVSQNQKIDRAGVFMAKLENQLGAIRKEMDEIEPQRKKLVALEEEYKRMQLLSLDLAKKVEESSDATATKLKLIRSEMEKEKVEIASFVNTVEETMDGYNESFNTKIETLFADTDKRLDDLKHRADTTIENLKDEFTSQRDELIASTSEERHHIMRELDEMGRKVNTLSVRVDEDVNGALLKFKEEMNAIEAGYSTKAKNFEGAIDTKIVEFGKTMKEDHEKVKSVSERWFGRIETDYKTLLANFNEIDKQQKNFESQTRLFERADKLKLELKAEIEELKRDLSIIEPERKKMNVVEAELAKTQKATTEVTGKIARFFAEKNKIDEMEKNIRQLMKVSESVEKRLESVTANHDVLQEIELKLRSLYDLEQKTETQFERLEKKNHVIETTTKEVENNFRLLDDLEKHVKRIDESVQGFPAKVSSISEQIKFLVDDKQKADAAVEQVNKVHELLADIEERMKKLQVAREWLSKTETRLETIGKNANEQLNLLRAIMKDDGGADGKKGKGAPSYDTRQMIVKLARQGWAIKEIAKASNVSQGEVELILELEPQKR